MKWNREDIAWAAGLFEGEGCISIHGKVGQSKYANLTIRMADEDVIRKVNSCLQIGRVNGPYSAKLKHWKPMWVWSVSGFEKVQAVIAAFWPWLGERRRAKAVEVLRVAREYLLKHKEERPDFSALYSHITIDTLDV